MNKFTLIPFFLLIFLSAKAQDRIISIEHDTINCKILSIRNECIFYELKNDDGSVTGRSIPLSQIIEFFNSNPADEKSKMSKQKTPKIAHAPENPLCFGLNAGVSSMPWFLDIFQSSSDMPDYYKKLKTGIHVNTSVHYMVNSFLGLGVEHSFFKTSTSGTMPNEVNTSIFIMSSEKYCQYVNYLGASVLFKQHLDTKGKFNIIESLSAGILFLNLEDQITYPNVSQFEYNDIVNNTLLTGNSFCGKIGLTAEYRLSRNVSLGIGADFIRCSLKKANVKSKGSNNYSFSNNNQELSKAMNLSRIDYSFALRYYF